MIYEFMEQEKIPGMTLAIVQAPYIPRVVSYGVSDPMTGKLASAKTLWPAGPISQGYAAVAVMQLYELGKLGLNDPISRYLDSIPDAWKNVTVFQLLQHSSGIADYRMQDGFDQGRKVAAKDLIGLAGNFPLRFEPGTDVMQSATNFLLAAEIVEKASGQTYRDFVTKNQIEYLGLRQTMFSDDFSKLKQEKLENLQSRHALFKSDMLYIDPAETASGFLLVDGNLRPAAPFESAAFKGFCDIWASAGDISFWDIGLAGSVLIKKPENRDLIYKPTKLANGKTVPAMAGWQFQHHKGLMDIKGNAPGFSAFLSRFTDASELVCVTLLANREGVDLTNLARKIAGAFDDRMGSGVNDENLYTYESVFGVEETVHRLERELERRKIPVFAKYDHAKNAQGANQSLRPTAVLVFGSPAVGTALMQANPSIVFLKEIALAASRVRVENLDQNNARPLVAPARLEDPAQARQGRFHDLERAGRGHRKRNQRRV